MLGDFQHLHSKDAEAVLFELFDDVAHSIFGDCVRFHDSKSALQCFHNWLFVVRPSSLFVRWFVFARYTVPGSSRLSLLEPPPVFLRLQPETSPPECRLLP